MDLWKRACHCKSPSCQVQWYCGSRDNMVLVLSCDIAKPPNQRVMWLCRWKPAKFEGHGHCGSRDIMVFVSHVILEDHLT